MDVYVAWLVYYIVTLPIFLAHTYIIVYIMGKHLKRGFGLLLFVLLFVVLMYVFSYLELILSHELLSKWFPEIFEINDSYLDAGNVLISGIGNLYIILVFSAVKMIRTWYLSSEEKKNLNQRFLENRVAAANSKIQPGLLMFAAEQIELLAEKGSENVSASIAILSEILNSTMLTSDRIYCRIDEEVNMIKKLFHLHALMFDKENVQIEVLGLDLHKSRVPVLVLFSIIEVVMRNLKGTEKVSIDLSEPGSAFEAKITWNLVSENQPYPNLIAIDEEMNLLFPKKYSMKDDIKKHQYILELVEKAN